MQYEVACLDMDGVIVDLVTAAMRTHGRGDLLLPGAWPKGCYTLEDILGISTEEFWAPIDAQGQAWWQGLEPYPWIDSLLQHARLLARDVVIVTKPHQTAACIAGKLEWVRRWCPGLLKTMVTCSQKWRLAGPRRLLIDDCEDNVREWRNAGGVALLFPQPWNTAQGDYSTVLNEWGRLVS